MTSSDASGPAPTLNDVATRAGVSLATASRVLNGSTRKVAESFRERVQAAARELNYVPNLPAQATARGTSNLVALLVADITDPYFGLIAKGVSKALDGTGLVMTIGITGRDPERELELVRALRGQRPRGVILAASRTGQTDTPELYDELDAIVARGGRVSMVGGGSGMARVVRADNTGGARALAAQLVERGYTDAVILAAVGSLVSSDTRVEGFTEGFVAHGCDAPRVIRAGFDWDAGYAAMTELLSEGIPATTVVACVNDVMAIGAMRAVREAGLEPGRDVAVCGFDNIPTSRDVWPALTTVHLSLGELGTNAVQAILDDDWQAAEPVPFEVHLRDSTPPRD